MNESLFLKGMEKAQGLQAHPHIDEAYDPEVIVNS
jgi:hypothetical protein